MDGLELIALLNDGSHLGETNQRIEVYGHAGFPIEGKMKLYGKEQHLTFVQGENGLIKRVTNGNGTTFNIDNGLNDLQTPEYLDPVGVKLDLKPGWRVLGPRSMSGTYGGMPVQFQFNYWIDGTVSKIGMQMGQQSIVRVEFSENSYDRIVGRQKGMDTGLDIKLSRYIYGKEHTMYPLLLSLV